MEVALECFLKISFLVSFVIFCVVAIFSLVCTNRASQLNDVDSFGAKLLMDKIYDGIKSSLLAAFAWFTLIYNSDSNALFKVIGKESSLELLGTMVFFLTTITFQGMNYGFAKDRSDNTLNGSSRKTLKSVMIILFIIIFYISVSHILELYVFKPGDGIKHG